MFDLRSLWVCQSREQRWCNSVQLQPRAGSAGTSVGMQRRGAALDRQTDTLAGTPHHPWDLQPTAAPQPASGSGTAPSVPLAASPLRHALTPPSPVPRVRQKDTAKQTRIAAQRHSLPNNPTPSPPPARGTSITAVSSPRLCPGRETGRKMKIKFP